MINILSRIWGWLQTGFGLANGFIDALYTPLGTASNYSATADLHNLQINTVHAKHFPAYCFFTRRFLATAFNSGDASVSRSQVLLSQPPLQSSTELIAPILFFITTSNGPNRKHRFQQYIYCCRGVFTDPLLRNWLHNTVVLLLHALSGNGLCLQSHRLVTGVCARLAVGNLWIYLNTNVRLQWGIT
jgi:hypothetical protein